MPEDSKYANGMLFFVDDDGSMETDDEKNILMFMTNSDKTELRNSDELFIDGTFSICDKFKNKYSQLIVISQRRFNSNFPGRSVANPLCFAFLQEKFEF